MKTFLFGFGLGVACVNLTIAFWGSGTATLVVAIVGMMAMIAGACWE